MNSAKAPSLFQIMGVVNITPDSFSDGGRFINPRQAVDQALRLIEAGADVLDLGAESTRPGAGAVDPEEERRRLLPVLDLLLKDVPASKVSIDTRRSALAMEVAALGVGYINNVEGFMPDDVMKRLSHSGCGYIAMHMHGEPGTMQNAPLNKESALASMDRFVAEAINSFGRAGLPASKCFVDPGIGFGKSDSANLALMTTLPRYAEKCAGKCRVAVGISRKSLFGRLLGIEVPAMRDDAGKVVEFMLGIFGADLVRTHDVARLAKIRNTYAAGS